MIDEIVNEGESESGSDGEVGKIAPEALSHNADAEAHGDKRNEERKVTEKGRFAGVCQIAQVVENIIAVAYGVYSESESRRRSRRSFEFGVAPVPRCGRRSE